MKQGILLLFIALSTQAIGQGTTNKTIDSLLVVAGRHISGAERDDAKAFKAYMQCAEMGHARSMNIVGILYKKGRGVPANGIEAVKWFNKAGEAGYAPAWYNLGLHYKGMKPPSQDFEKAYECFSRGAIEGDSLSEFMKGYMLYKGLGCDQDYEEASVFFKKGAYRGMTYGMYFLGLCFRNGYGMQANADSAQYWLQMAAKRSSRQALMELTSEEAENGDMQAKELALKIKNAAAPLPANPMNKYQRVERSISAGIITGKYIGYLIKYDWSGENVIGVSPLILEISGHNGTIYGIWSEGDSLRVPLAARITSKSMIFLHTTYSRTDHYSPDKPVPYTFEDANLQWVQKEDTVFLAGNIQLFSPLRNEPHKPLSIALTKVGKSANDELIKFTNIDGTPLRDEQLLAYPNPFKNVVTVDFELKEKCEVATQLITLDGNVVYTNKAGRLDAGYYTLPLLPSQVAAGVYLLVLRYGNKTKTVKLVKE